MRSKLVLISIILISVSSIYGMWTPQQKLFLGAMYGSIALVEEALKECANVNSQDAFGDTALIYAANGGTDLIYAANHGYNEIIKKLIKAGADVNLQNKPGSTALMHAADLGYNEIVKQLLDAGTDVYIKNKEGQTAIDIVIEKGLVKILQLLLDHLEQQRKTIEESLPLPDVLQEITTEYLGYPKVMKKKKM